MNIWSACTGTKASIFPAVGPCVLLAAGKAKAEIIAKAVEGPLTAMISASALQLHPRCTVVVDEAAAERLQGTDYYRWIFNHEPEWAKFR